MAINKNFVIKNGAEINTKLLVADADTQKVGIGTTRPSYTLHVMGPGDNTGGIGATYIYTTGITTTQALNVLGVSTFNAGPILLARGEQTGTPSQSLQVGTSTTVSGAYISGNLGLANTNPTSTLHVVGDTLITGVTTISGGISLPQGADLARLRVTGITTLGQANITGLSNAGISTLGNATASTLVVSGFSTLGSVSAANLGLAGITTGLNVPGISTFGNTTVANLSLAGITTGLNASGISTLTSLTGTNANYSGISTISSLVATNVSVSGVTTTDSLKVNSSLDVYASNAVFHNDVTIIGNVSIGGTSTIINAQSLVVEDKDIILGFTTSQLPTDTTANHGGIAVASTEGTPLVTFAVTGINTLPPTYKQIMWVRSGTMGAGTTDAWLFNYSVGIGSTLVPNDVRLAVGAVQVTEDGINARVGNLTHVRSTNINATGITTTNSLSIDATQVISSARQLQNIASLDAVTTATIETAISNAPNTFTDLNITGFSTLGAASATLLNVSGVTTVAGGLNASQGADLARLRVTGITTLGQANITGLSNAGVSTLGNATASTLVVSGVSTIGFATASNLTVTGVVTAFGGLQGIGIQTNGVNVTTGIITALNFVGTGNTITYDAPTKTVSINIAGSAGGGGGGGVTEIKTSGISTTNPIGVGSFATASFRSASVVAQINQNAQYQVGRYLMIHDGTTVTLVEDAAVSTGSSMLGTFTGAIIGSNAELRVSLALPQSTAGVATVTTKIDTITL